jgi:hypothetical protein
VRTELLQQVRSQLKELRGLGVRYDLVPSRQARTRKTAKPCKICGFQTAKPHDARAHRWQEPKAPFTDDELASKGLRLVGKRLATSAPKRSKRKRANGRAEGERPRA